MSVVKGPSVVTIRNEPNGHIGVHSNGPVVVKLGGMIEKTIPKMDQYVAGEPRR
jgi:hypothetical protein